MLPFWPAVWMMVGALAGCGAVGMAAAAAHALPQRLDEQALHAVESAIQMQGWHALALLITGLWMTKAGPLPANVANAAGAAFALGTLLFCGAVYARHLGNLTLGPVAPAGGLLLMLGWLLLAVSVGLAAR